VTARRKARRCRALFPSAERLHVQLAKIEALQGQRGQRLFVFMPPHAEAKPAEFGPGEGPQPGDPVIYFEPLHATAEEAAIPVEQLRERYCQRTDRGTRPPAWERVSARDGGPPRRSPGADVENVQAPAVDADEYPRPEFGLSDRGTLIFRVRRRASQVDRWRAAADADKDAWPTTFRAFVEDLLEVLDARLANINASSSEEDSS
jgi:hypothetical protein